VPTRRILIILLIVGSLSGAQEVVEEVVAVVAETPVLASDVALAGLVGLLEPDPGEPEAAFRSRLIDARIRLELQYRDLADSGLLYRLEIAPDAVRSELVARAGGEQELQAGLDRYGLVWEDLDELSLRIAAAAAYADQRLRPRVRVGFEELQAAYQELVVVEAERSGVPAPPLTEVSDQLHRLLVERQLNQEIEQWLESAAERHEVTRFVP
jgi:hypothetical protein